MGRDSELLTRLACPLTHVYILAQMRAHRDQAVPSRERFWTRGFAIFAGEREHVFHQHARAEKVFFEAPD